MASDDYGFPVKLGQDISRQGRRDEIQECISIAWMEHWPEELGIRPEGSAACSADDPEGA